MTRRHPTVTRRRDEAADAVMAACDEAGGAIPSAFAVHVIAGVDGVSGRGMAAADFECLIRDGRLTRAKVRGVWWCWPTVCGLAVAERLLVGSAAA